MFGTRITLIIALVVTVLLSACSSGPGGETTCAEFLALEKPMREQIYGGNEEQEKIVKRMLSAHGLDTGLGNVATAEMHIMQFCGMKDYPESMNSNRPIKDAIE